MNEVTTYRDFNSNKGIKDELRATARNAAIGILSVRKDISKTKNWVQFPYYHHVFDDEKKGFENQLKYLKNYGDFISMDQACALISGDNSMDGRYFCVSFDDGLRSTYSNMAEITNRLNVPVMIYLASSYIGLDNTDPKSVEKIRQFYPEDPKFVPFLSWDECREMLSQKVSFGSHTVNHANLSKISPAEIEVELAKSKEEIEAQLKVTCNHFACPWGRAGIDFDPAITTGIAKKVGYKSFATTNRGIMEKGDDLYQLRRQHLLANWGTYQLKYFFGV